MSVQKTEEDKKQRGLGDMVGGKRVAMCLRYIADSGSKGMAYVGTWSTYVWMDRGALVNIIKT